MKFSEHLAEQPHLLLCGGCPFLRFPYNNSLGEINQKNSDQRNECGLEKHNFGEADEFNRGTWGILGKGQNPKRTKGCLQLFKHFHTQIAHRKHPGYDNRTCGGEHDWARYDEDDNARSRA